MTAEILSWSRSRGAFAGVSLEGATLRNDLDENEALYGKKLNNRDVVRGDRAVPAAAAKFVGALNKVLPPKGAELDYRWAITAVWKVGAKGTFSQWVKPAWRNISAYSRNV